MYAVREPSKQDLIKIGDPGRARNGGCVDGEGNGGGNGDVFEQADVIC